VVIVVVPIIIDGFPGALVASPGALDRSTPAFPSWCFPSTAVVASEQQQQDLS
jgi:hypothetical protein